MKTEIEEIEKDRIDSKGKASELEYKEAIAKQKQEIRQNILNSNVKRSLSAFINFNATSKYEL